MVRFKFDLLVDLSGNRAFEADSVEEESYHSLKLYRVLNSIWTYREIERNFEITSQTFEVRSDVGDFGLASRNWSPYAWSAIIIVGTALDNEKLTFGHAQ